MGAVQAIRRLGSISNALTETAPELSLAEQIRTAIYEMRFAQRGISLGVFESPKDLLKAEILFRDCGAQIDSILNELRPLLESAKGALCWTP